MMSMTTIGYARVSTGDQTTDLQRDALMRAGCDLVLQDHGVSGVKARPELAKAIESLQAGDVLVVWRLDRLGRSLSDLLALVQQIEAKGAGLRSLTETIDTTTAGGRLIFHVFASIAQFERELTQERSRAGRAAAKARGKHLGRPRVVTPDQLRLYAMLVENGESIRSVARTHGIDPSTLSRHLAASAS